MRTRTLYGSLRCGGTRGGANQAHPHRAEPLRSGFREGDEAASRAGPSDAVWSSVLDGKGRWRFEARQGVPTESTPLPSLSGASRRSSAAATGTLAAIRRWVHENAGMGGLHFLLPVFKTRWKLPPTRFRKTEKVLDIGSCEFGASERAFSCLLTDPLQSFIDHDPLVN